MANFQIVFAAVLFVVLAHSAWAMCNAITQSAFCEASEFPFALWLGYGIGAGLFLIGLFVEPEEDSTVDERKTVNLENPKQSDWGTGYEFDAVCRNCGSVQRVYSVRGSSQEDSIKDGLIACKMCGGHRMVPAQRI